MIATGWLGTPYRHQGSLRGVGCDCLGLVRGVWRDLYGQEPEQPAPYAADWAERSGEDRLMEAALRHFGPPLPPSFAMADGTLPGNMQPGNMQPGNMQPGDLLLFRWRPGMPAKHAGLYAGEDRFIHAYEQAAVVMSPLVPSWRRRIAAVFRFPERS